MSSADRVAVSLVEKAKRSRDDLDARLLLAAAVQRIASGCGMQTIVVGGTAADFYAAGAAGTAAAYPAKWRASADVDLVALSLRGGPVSLTRLKESLVEHLGFEPLFLTADAEGQPVWSRGFNVPGLGYGFEIVSDSLEGDPAAERVLTVEVDGHPVVLRGPEDVLLEYAESGAAFRHTGDWERALATWRTMREELDMGYVESRAHERGIREIVAAVTEGKPLQDVLAAR